MFGRNRFLNRICGPKPVRNRSSEPETGIQPNPNRNISVSGFEPESDTEHWIQHDDASLRELGRQLGCTLHIGVLHFANETRRSGGTVAERGDRASVKASGGTQTLRKCVQTMCEHLSIHIPNHLGVRKYIHAP